MGVTGGGCGWWWGGAGDYRAGGGRARLGNGLWHVALKEVGDRLVDILRTHWRLRRSCVVL